MADVDSIIGFKIEEINTEQNYVAVRLSSPNFKNPPETYPVCNISLTNLGSDNITTQILNYVKPLVVGILRQESGETETVAQNIANLVGQTISESLSTISQPSINSADINFVA